MPAPDSPGPLPVPPAPPATAAPPAIPIGQSTALATELREALQLLWRRFTAHRTLSLGKVGILSHLDVRGPLAATDLAGLERISHQAIANAVREMQELGLVSRSPDPTDGRRTLIHLTDIGRSRLKSERTAGQDWLVRAVEEHLDSTERATLAAAIPLIRRLDLEGDTGTESGPAEVRQ